MTRHIHKVVWDDRTSKIWVPADFQTLLVAEQRGKLAVWYTTFTTSNGTEPLTKLTVVGTGDAVPIDHTHTGSAVVGGMVWHVFIPMEGVDHG